MARSSRSSSPRSSSSSRPGTAATLPDLIARRAAERPQAVAIEAPGRRPLTYEGLARHVEAVAAALRGHGIDRGERVALVTGNGPEAASAFLAIAALGAAAPLNPDYVEEELAYYFSAIKPRAVLVGGSAADRAASVARRHGIAALQIVPGVCAGEFSLKPESSPVAADRSPAPADTALLLHTSGTTARPKLVPLSHANLLASAAAIASTLRLTGDDICLNIMPLFHVHGQVAALLATLAGGGRVVCTPGFHALRFFEWLESFKPTWYTAVPTMHQAILARAADFPQAVAHAKLRFIRSSSAALPPQVMEGLERVFRAPVIEAYGMTEASHQMASNPLPPERRKPGSVGPAAGPEIGILGDDGKFLGAGKAGEVVIRGPGVTAGYLDNDEANARAFHDGWFRTGDQGMLDGDGYLTLTGRLKEFINRGGEKVAPREVDEILLDHEAVAEAVTFAVPDPALGEDVGAAVVLRPGKSASVPDIKAFAATRLAYFKVPRHLLIVERIPKGATGKIQRVGMAERLGIEAGKGSSDETAPRNETETLLAEIWRQVLQVKQVGVLARFLDLGGDSILAADLVARVSDEFAVELTLVDVFDTPTVADMAIRIAEKRARAVEANLPPLTARKARGPAPLSFNQDWWLSLEARAPKSAASNRPSSLHLQGPLDPAALRRAFAAVVRRHESLRTRLRAGNGAWLQEPIDLDFVLEESDLSRATEPLAAARAELAAAAAQMLDLETAPLFRARLLRLAADDHVLLFVVHHLIIDGWSRTVFTRDLAALYGAFAQDGDAGLPELPVQYADFATWQRKMLAGSRLELLTRFWREKLRGFAPPPLPADRPRPAAPTLTGVTVRSVVPPLVAAAARALGAGEGATLYMTCLAAFHLLLGRYAGVDDVGTGCLVTGRHPAATQPLIGLFFNAVVMRSDLSGNPTVRALIRRVRDFAMAALAHQDMPVGELVRILGAGEAKGGSPVALVPILFQMRNFPQPHETAGGVTFTPFKADSGMARFDLTLDLEESDQGLVCILDLNRDLFDAATGDAILADFTSLLAAMTAQPDAPVTTLPPAKHRPRRLGAVSEGGS